MDVRDAVNIAKQYVIELYADERVANVGLEEVDFDEVKNTWYVTVGFSRPWDEPKNTLVALAGGQYAKRSFKVLRISDVSKKVLSIKNREETS